MDVVTPYVSQDLFLTKSFDSEFANQLVSRGGEIGGPFPRKVDLWWSAVIIGVAIGHRSPMPSNEQLTKFHTGAIFGREPWRVSHLELIALAEEGEAVMTKPSEIIRIGHEFSMTGLGWLAEELRGSAQPIIKLFTALEEIESISVAQ